MTLSAYSPKKLPPSQELKSDGVGKLRSQRGNVVVYVIIFMISWFAFFVIKDWIKDTKDARQQKGQRQVDEGPYQEDLYSNPYQRSK